MSPKTLESRHAIESCTFQLHTWRPFHLIPTALKTLDSDSYAPYSNGVHAKKPCLSDRTTSFPIESLDMSKLSLFDDDRVLSTRNRRDSFSWIARKRRRRGSRSVSGRSSDRSGTRRRCCSVGASAAANATCSDFPVANGTDSSGELFLNGDANWASDVSEAARHGGGGGGNGERENISVVCGQIGNFDGQGNESGYGSEPGYRGDAEFGYGDEVDEEEDDPRLLFWANKFGDEDSNMEIIGENSVQKTHHRCRRKKHDLRMVHPCR